MSRYLISGAEVLRKHSLVRSFGLLPVATDNRAKHVNTGNSPNPPRPNIIVVMLVAISATFSKSGVKFVCHDRCI